MKIKITEEQLKIFNLLLEAKESVSARKIAEKLNIDQSQVMGTLTYGSENNWVNIKKVEREELVPSEEAETLLKNNLPERKMLPVISEQGPLSMQEVAKKAQQLNIQMKDIIKWGFQKKWFQKQEGSLAITETGKKYINQKDDDERALKAALENNGIYLDELEDMDIDRKRVKKLLSNRPELAKIKKRTIRYASLTEKGEEMLSSRVKVRKEKNVLSSEDITSGEWKNIDLKSYDVTIEAEKIYPAKIHPLQKIIQQVRKVFLEMGFEEIVSPLAESAFWDFDALFQPQDHPARDMQDTFYMKRPEKGKLPDEELVKKVKATHENGWETGSSGWDYKWSEKKAREIVLRTHTTATTIRALEQNPNPPRKVFCVGRVFRNEAISYKHLPEFHQVDGVIIDEDANLSTLLGTLKEFYYKMGFKKVKFKPDFFPYTEPSAEVSGWMPSKNSWIELGGSGVFRPEVTVPLGCKVPVLAWGLGIERLAMLRYGFDDIRELYWSNLDKLKEVSLCQ